MGEEKYQIVFKGDIAQGNDVNSVKKNLAALFRIGTDKIEQFFSGQPMVEKGHNALENQVSKTSVS